MKALLVSRSRLRERSLVERFDYYEKLLRRRIPIERRLVKKGSLLACVPDRWRSVALDEHAEQPTSKAFAARVDRWQNTGVPGVVFLIGDAEGFQPGEREGADAAISLSRLTLPHQLCFVILAEQLYRASAILRGEAYHKE